MKIVCILFGILIEKFSLEKKNSSCYLIPNDDDEEEKEEEGERKQKRRWCCCYGFTIGRVDESSVSDLFSLCIENRFFFYFHSFERENTASCLLRKKLFF